MYRVLDILTPEEIAECRTIAANATFVHGKISNPHNKAKQNEQLHEAAAYERSAKLVLQAMMRSDEFREFAFPAQIAPPLLLLPRLLAVTSRSRFHSTRSNESGSIQTCGRPCSRPQVV